MPIDGLVTIHRGGQPLPDTLAMLYIEQMLRAAGRLSMAASSDTPALRTWIKWVLLPASGRGISARMLWSTHPDDPPGRLVSQPVADLVARGVTVRLNPSPVREVLLFGGKAAAVPGRAAGRWDLHDRSFANAVSTEFDQAWDRAHEIRCTGRLALNPIDQRVVRLLARGVKDESAARQLGVSTRTYRRHVTQLCHQLEASSRFAAGANAVRKGWI